MKILSFKEKSCWGTGSACSQLTVVLHEHSLCSCAVAAAVLWMLLGSCAKQGWLWPHAYVPVGCMCSCLSRPCWNRALWGSFDMSDPGSKPSSFLVLEILWRHLPIAVMHPRLLSAPVVQGKVVLELACIVQGLGGLCVCSLWKVAASVGFGQVGLQVIVTFTVPWLFSLLVVRTQVMGWSTSSVPAY